MKIKTIFKHRKVLFWFIIARLKGVVMGKKIKRVKADKPSRKPPKKGDKYVLTNDVSVADVDGDGVSDVVVDHVVTKNGELMVSAKVVWYGLEGSVTDAFVTALEDAGIVDDDVVKTNKFGVLAKSWKKLTKALKTINDLGDVKATELD